MDFSVERQSSQHYDLTKAQLTGCGCKAFTISKWDLIFADQVIGPQLINMSMLLVCRILGVPDNSCLKGVYRMGTKSDYTVHAGILIFNLNLSLSFHQQTSNSLFSVSVFLRGSLLILFWLSFIPCYVIELIYTTFRQLND